MIFKLEIELGNDGMRTPDDVSGVLRQVARDIEDFLEWTSTDGPGTLRDINGNKVGKWDLEVS